MTRREPRFRFANEAGSPTATSWSRARDAHEARTYVVAGPTARSVKPAGIRATRTIRRDATRRSATLVRGWRR